MNFWIFKANPGKYRLDDRLSDPNPEITWGVTRYKDRIHQGDKAFIWRAGNPRGVCAIMDIETDPVEMEEIASELAYSFPTEDHGRTLRVKGSLVSRFPLVESGILKLINGLEGLSVFHGFQQATNFPVTEEEAGIIMGIIGGNNLL